jgi:phosphatidylserine/phosphatidylglycerophosphate/cardiolipin synthase-like enzyme
MKGLAAALESGNVAPPFHKSQLLRQIPEELVKGILYELRVLSSDGMAPAHIAYMLRLLSDERAASQAIADRVELVWSGTEVMAGGSRDTAVVVQELFREARESILVSSYALDSGSKAEALFGTLAKRMDAEPELAVQLFLNVNRKHLDETAAAVLLREFADGFRDETWPGERLPEVFYDPRSLATDGTKRASLHAKCVVVDDDRALITSANFTEAAHERNIEAGTVITDTILAQSLRAQFDTLVDHGALKRVPGL